MGFRGASTVRAALNLRFLSVAGDGLPSASAVVQTLLCRAGVSRALPAVLLVLACHPGGLAPSHGLAVSPDALRLSPALPEATFVLRNTGQDAEQVALNASAPFSVTPSSVALAAGDAVTVTVTFAPTADGVFTQTLTAAGTTASAAVALTGETPCVSTKACRQSARDPSTGACVESPVANGTSCPSACLNGATCLDGTCVGQPVSCDDGNPCTLDLCADDTGCFHADGTASCPSDSCNAPTCSPDAGCGLSPVPDGTSCGPGDCTVHTCIAGVCVERAMPDNSPCGRASTCQSAGTCQGGACARPPATTLQRAWRHDVPSDSQLWSPLMIDSAGRLHWLECGSSMPGCTHVAFTEDGVQLYRQPVPDIPYLSNQALLTDTLLVAGLYTIVTAVNLSDGSKAWEHNFATELQQSGPACGTVPGMSFPYLTAMADDGHGGLLVQFQDQGCGDWWSGAWTVKLDAQTGATQWVRPYLGAWMTCDLSYGGGSIAADEAGNAYVFEGFNGGCGSPTTGVTPRVSSYAPDGSTRWTRPWTWVNWPTALSSGLLFDQSGERVSVSDGGVLSTLALPPPNYNVDTVFSSRGGFTVNGFYDDDGMSLFRLNAQGTVDWSMSFDAGPGFIMGTSPTLTASDSLLLPVASHPSGNELWEVAADAGISRCPLPGLPAGLVSQYDQSVLTPGGMWVVVHLSPWYAVEGYPLTGVAPATSGWIRPGGSETNGRHPR
jgi:hypothetical protein